MNRHILVVAGLAAIAAPSLSADRPTLSEREAKELDKALAGKVAGKPRTCVPMGRGSDGLRPISDTVVLYRVSRDLTYRNDLVGRCNSIGRGGNTLVLKPDVNQYCAGDIARSVDLNNGIPSGACALGEFVPYRTPGTEPRNR